MNGSLSPSVFTLPLADIPPGRTLSKSLVFICRFRVRWISRSSGAWTCSVVCAAALATFGRYMMGFNSYVRKGDMCSIDEMSRIAIEKLRHLFRQELGTSGKDIPFSARVVRAMDVDCTSSTKTVSNIGWPISYRRMFADFG
ncbi:hypothetical protein KCU92_g173, partial [Aureobasidium melanogenum]